LRYNTNLLTKTEFQVSFVCQLNRIEWPTSRGKRHECPENQSRCFPI
jgi:hypothetical protein